MVWFVLCALYVILGTLMAGLGDPLALVAGLVDIAAGFACYCAANGMFAVALDRPAAVRPRSERPRQVHPGEEPRNLARQSGSHGDHNRRRAG